MTLLAVFFAGVIIAAGVDRLADRVLWSKRRDIMLGSLNASLDINARMYAIADDMRKVSPEAEELLELALVDLSEQDAALRRRRTVLSWT